MKDDLKSLRSDLDMARDYIEDALVSAKLLDDSDLIDATKKALDEVDFALDEVDDKLDELEQEGDNQ